MGPRVRKIAVNIVDVYDLKEVHDHVVNFLYPSRDLYELDVANSEIKIDFYICNERSDGASGVLEFAPETIVHNVKLKGYEPLTNSIRTPTNITLCNKAENLIKNLYRSWQNSNTMQQNSLKDTYSLVITYDRSLSMHKAKYLYDKKFLMELDLVFAIMHEPRWLNMDYKCFVSSYSGFNKIVNLWRFFPYLEDATFNIWDWFRENNDPGGFILPMWLNMQTLKVRNIANDT